jgi:hypothetical protein
VEIALTDPVTHLGAGSVAIQLVLAALKETPSVLQEAAEAAAAVGGAGGVSGLRATMSKAMSIGASTTGAGRVSAVSMGEDGGGDWSSESSSEASVWTSDSEDESDADDGANQLLESSFDAGLKVSLDEINAQNWVVATSMAADKYTKFQIHPVDRKSSSSGGGGAGDDDTVDYMERFVFQHSYTGQRLKLSTLLGMAHNNNPNGWWEYSGDASLVPDPHREDSIIDSEVCQFSRVDDEEVREIWPKPQPLRYS